MEIYTDDLGFRHQEFFHDLKVRFLYKGSLYFYMYPLKLRTLISSSITSESSTMVSLIINRLICAYFHAHLKDLS